MHETMSRGRGGVRVLQDGLIGWLRAGKGQIGLGRLTLRVETLWQGGWMLFATVVTGVLNYLSNVFVGRMLGPADYSIFASMVSLSIIFMVASGIIQTVVTNYVTCLRGQGMTSEVSVLFVYMLKRLLPWGLGGAAMLALLARPLAGFLRLPLAVPVIVMSLFVLPTVLLPVVYGMQRGLQRFGALGGTQVSMAFFRLAAVAGFIALGLGTGGAVASLPLSGLGAFAVGMVPLIDVLRHQRSGIAPILEGVFTYSLNTALALLCFAVLTNSEVILVKNRFSPTEAGLYSAVAVLGKTTLWVSGAVVALLLPKVTEQHTRGLPVTRMLRKSML